MGVLIYNRPRINIGFRAGISNYIHLTQFYVISHPCPNFNSGLLKPPLKLGYGEVITYHVQDMITYPSANSS